MDALTDIFPWNGNFETGFQEIDDQHRGLVHLLNRLASHWARQSDLTTLNDVFDELTAYALYHFSSEEAVWQAHLPGDPWEADHRKSHEEFLIAVSKLKAKEAHTSLSTVIEEVVRFLAQWLAFHILESDKRLAVAARAVQGGCSLDEAKRLADREMSEVKRGLIETILAMYDSLISRALQLAKEMIERKKAEGKLRLAGHVFENTLDAICITDSGRVVVEANPAFYSSCDRLPEEIVGRPLGEVKYGLGITEETWTAAFELGHWDGEVSDRGVNGELESKWLTLSSIVGEDGVLSNYVAVFSNVAGLMTHRKELERIANHDILTGLPNRLLLADRLQHGLAHARRSDRRLAVCFLDLDGFKEINDSLGHDTGDCVLKELSKRILHVIRGEDTLARLGGDEFVVLLGDIASPRDCEMVLQKIVDAVRRPFLLAKGEAFVSASIGVAVFPDHTEDAQTLLALADQAMYGAKKAGRSQYMFHGS